MERIKKEDVTERWKKIFRDKGVSEDVAAKVLEYLEETWGEEPEFYPGPTALERIQHIFGELTPITEYKQRYSGVNQRHYIYEGVFKKPIAFQLELPGLQEDNLAEVDRMIYEHTDALALKCFHAVLSECWRQNQSWNAMCHYDANTICDLLGYKRDLKGYHRSGNIDQVEKRLRLLAKLRYRFELLGYDPKTEADRMVFDEALLKIEPDDTVELSKKTTRIAKKTKIRISDRLYDNMAKRKMFAWFDREFLKMDTRKHSRAILLYSYYVSQLAMGMKQRRGLKNVVSRPLETVFRETGIMIDETNRHKGRDMDSFVKAHIELKARGLIKDFSLLVGAEGRVEITFDENHPTLGKYKEIQGIEADSEDED